jgi:hypothetical protein
VVKRVVKDNYFPRVDEKDIIWLSECHITQTVGYFDYVAVLAKRSGDSMVLQDFVCVELQAAGTTGTPWTAFLEHKKHGRFLKDTYDFGINWANEFAKTMMQQAYKKGLIVSQWKKKLVFFIQDIGLKYLEQNYDVSGLHSPRDSDPIEFCTVEMKWDENRNNWDLQFVRRRSTDEDGVRKMLGGVNEESYPTIDQFSKRIAEKAETQYSTVKRPAA